MKTFLGYYRIVPSFITWYHPSKHFGYMYCIVRFRCMIDCIVTLEQFNRCIICYLGFCLPESLHKEVQDLAFLDVVSKLRSHENKSVAQQASLTEQRLTVDSWELPLPDTWHHPSSDFPFVLHLLPYHLCMRVMFQYQLKNCCRYLPNKISKPIVSVNMNLSKTSLHP